MFNKIKSKFKNFASCWKYEKHLIKTCNRATPLHRKVCESISWFLIVVFSLIGIIGLFSVSSSAAPPISNSPSNLTGYTVTVPSNWTVTSGFGQYQIDYSLDDTGWYLYLGYRFNETMDAVASANWVSFTDSGGFPVRSYDSPDSFTFTVYGGNDVSNPSLIQWLDANGATYVPGSIPDPEPDPDPEPEISSIAGGVYHFKSFGNLPDIPDASWSDGTGYTYSYTLAGKYVTTSRTIAFTGFNVTFDEYVSNSHYTVTFSVDTDDDVINLATYSASYGQIELVTRADLKYLVFDESLVGSYDDIEFIRQFLVSGFPDTDTSATDNPWAYILEMIIEALKVDLFGYFSVWDIFTTICGIFIVTWLLKLLAGG